MGDETRDSPEKTAETTQDMILGRNGATECQSKGLCPSWPLPPTPLVFIIITIIIIIIIITHHHHHHIIIITTTTTIITIIITTIIIIIC
ncbi:hypothetical protein STEG23_000855, partial [Scotinomys teguina]